MGKDTYLNNTYSIEERLSDLLSKMTLEEKAAQMVQCEVTVTDQFNSKEYYIGSVMSSGNRVLGENTHLVYRDTIRELQRQALNKRLKIPILYGIDAVHGHSKIKGATVFPHNIGIGAMANEGLSYQMGKIVAEEMKLSNITWNFHPCVSVSQDPRWGRTYECYSSNPDLVKKLASAYFRGMSDNGVLPTAKHFIADGETTYGTGHGRYPLDRGNTSISIERLKSIHLPPFIELIKQGLQVIIASFSSFDGVRMHENKYLLNDLLKDELNFKGFVLSDWEAIETIKAESLTEKVYKSVNSGIDMLMQPYNSCEVISSIILSVNNGFITKERLDDAVCRILKVKFNMGLFDDPYLLNCNYKGDLRSDSSCEVAKEIVEKSLTLLKNDSNILPLKNKKIFALGPALDDLATQCGGWTVNWQGGGENIIGTSILQGMIELSIEAKNEIITDRSQAHTADIILLVVGEKPYAELLGDSEDISLNGQHGLEGNLEAIEFSRTLDLPIVTLVVAGRNTFVSDYIAHWDCLVMCYLPGTEGRGVASVLFGFSPFSGKLPMPWYHSVEDINEKNGKVLFEEGFGLLNDWGNA